MKTIHLLKHFGDGGQSWGDFPFGEAHREGAGIGAGVDLVFE